MRIRFLADADLHSGIARGLERLAPSIDFQPAQGIIPDGTPDPELLRLAAEDQRVLVSGDLRTMGKHFAVFTANNSSPGVVLIPSGTSVGEAIRRLHGFWLTVDAEEMVNQIRWLPNLP